MRRSLFWVLAILAGLSTSGRAQETVRGKVIDAEARIIPSATVTLHKIGADKIEGFAFTDKDGNFLLTTELSDSLVLRTRALGMLSDTQVILIPQEQPALITLMKGSLELPEAIVRSKRPPVTENGDTTVFNLSEFRDSSDRKIEEVLKKLPGVQVEEDGSIKVNGKPLAKLLVEGADLFGQDYQLGSKNINARDIGRVEVINHFEDNPVLQSVNNSQDIVLNLKLEDHVKAALAGTAILGSGYGKEEIKYSGYGALYRIARIQKMIFIGNADNVANAYGFNSSTNNYSSASSQQFRSMATQPLDIYSLPVINTGGLAPAYTDNADKRFGTIRNESDIGANLKLNTTATVEARNAEQLFTSTQAYVVDTSTFRLRNQEDWQRDDLFGQVDLLLTYIGSEEKTSVEAYVAAEGMKADQLGRYLNNSLDTFSYSPNVDYGSWVMKTAVNHKLAEGRVLRVNASAGGTSQDFGLLAPDPTLVNELSERDVQLNYTLTQGRYDGSVSYLLQANRSLMQVTVGGGHHSLGDKGTDRNYVNLGSSMNHQVSNSIGLRGGASLTRQYFQGDAGPSGLGYRLYAVATYGKRPASQAVLRVSSARQLPSLERQLSGLGYVYDPFQIVLPSLPVEFGKRSALSFSYNNRNDFTLRNWNISFRYTEATNLPAFEGAFANRFVLTQFGFNRGRTNAVLSTRYSKYSSVLKSDVAILLAADLSEVELGVNGEDQAVGFASQRIGLEAGLLLLKHFRLKGNTSLWIQNLRGSGSGTFTTWTSEFLLVYRRKLGEVLLGNSSLLATGNNQAQRAFGTYLGLQRDLKLKDQEIRISAKLYNPFGTQNYESQSAGTIFLFTSSVPALPRYFRFTVDWTI